MVVGAPQGTYIKDCSVHKSHFRCYALHGTNNVLLKDNVAYDSVGHCYFVEDAVEVIFFFDNLFFFSFFFLTSPFLFLKNKNKSMTMFLMEILDW